MKHLVFNYVVLLYCLCTAVSFDYEHQELWPGVCNTGRLQSPIPLYRSIAIRKDFTALSWEDYDKDATAVVVNNGHTAVLRLKNVVPPRIRGGGLPEHYTFDSLHFHWKSEHTIEGYRFPLEMHLVHYATPHMNLQNATKYPNGVAVMAVLYHLSPDDNKHFKPLEHVIRSLHGEVNVEKILDNIVLEDLLPIDTAGFYRYNGSLTTPTCDEVVVWTVFTNTVPISRKQVAVFEGLRSETNEVLHYTYRHLQKINSREIFLKKSPIRDNSALRHLNNVASPVLVGLGTTVANLLYRYY